MRISELSLLRILSAAAVLALSACDKPVRAVSGSSGSPHLVDPTAGGEMATRELTVEFGATLLGGEIRRSVLLTNDGPGTITVDAATLAEGSSSAFRCTTAPPLELRAGQRTEVAIRFLPTSDGEASGTLNLHVTRGDVDVLVVRLHGTCVQGTCAPSADHLDFGETSVGTSYRQTVTLWNGSPLALRVTVPELEAGSGFALAGGFAAVEHMVPAAGDSPGSLQIPIDFSPTRVGAATATLHLAASPCAADVVLRGTGVAHAVDCGPVVHSGLLEVCRVDFGYVHPGAKAVKPLLLRNRRSTDVTIANLSITQPIGSAPFGIEATEPRFVIPTGGAPVAIELSFGTDVLGEQRGQLEFTTDDVNRPLEYVELVAVGGGPAIEVGPSALDFGTAAVGLRLEQEIAIANVGEDAAATTADNLLLAIPDGDSWTEKHAEISGPNAAEFSLEWPPRGYGSEGLRGGETTTLTVRFVPSSVGTKQATLTIYSNDPAAPEVRIPISAGVEDLQPCDFAIEPAALDFGSVEPHGSLTLKFAIVNRAPDATQACMVSSGHVATTSGQANSFSWADGPLSIATIRGGERFYVPIRFQPDRSGSFRGEAQLYISNPGRSEVKVALSGVAESTCLFIAPREVDFGSIGMNCNSRQKIVTMYNTCASSLTVTAIDMVAGASREASLTKKPALPVSIAGGANADFGVTYHPTDLGTDAAAVAVTVTRNPNPYVVAISGNGNTGPLQTDTFSPRELPKVDVLFVIDNSSSMAGFQSALASNFASFIHYAVQQRVDYHIAVTTTDVSATGAAGQLLPLTSGGTRVVTRSTPAAELTFSDLANVGTSGSDTESLIRPAYLALSEPLLSGHNAGFYRDGAKLAVIVVSDAADTDPLGTAVLDYEAFLLNLKGVRRRNDITFSAVIPTQSSAPTDCTYDSPNAGGDLRVKTLIQHLAGLLDEICNPDWARTLEKLGTRTFDGRESFFLSNTPDMTWPDPIVVSIDGQPFPQYGTRGDKRWDYDSASNTIEFEVLALPDPGSTIRVTYHVACL